MACIRRGAPRASPEAASIPETSPYVGWARSIERAGGREVLRVGVAEPHAGGDLGGVLRDAAPDVAPTAGVARALGLGGTVSGRAFFRPLDPGDLSVPDPDADPSRTASARIVLRDLNPIMPSATMPRSDPSPEASGVRGSVEVGRVPPPPAFEPSRVERSMKRPLHPTGRKMTEAEEKAFV